MKCEPLLLELAERDREAWRGDEARCGEGTSTGDGELGIGIMLIIGEVSPACELAVSVTPAPSIGTGVLVPDRIEGCGDGRGEGNN